MNIALAPRSHCETILTIFNVNFFQKTKALEFLANMISIGSLLLPNLAKTTSKFNNLTYTIYP